MKALGADERAEELFAFELELLLVEEPAERDGLADAADLRVLPAGAVFFW